MSVGSRFVAPGESGCRKRAREPLFAPRRYASALEPWTGLVYNYYLLVYYYHCDGRRLGGGDASLVNRYYFWTGGRAHSLMGGTGRRRLGRTLVSLVHGARHCCYCYYYHHHPSPHPPHHHHPSSSCQPWLSQISLPVCEMAVTARSHPVPFFSLFLSWRCNSIGKGGGAEKTVTTRR